VINRHDRSNGLSVGNLEQVLKQKSYWTLPSDYLNLNEAINRGVPLANVAPKSRLWSSLEGLAHQLQGQLHKGNGLREAQPRRRFWVL
jgi:Flp pilus assembly CpaE family ATPase